MLLSVAALLLKADEQLGSAGLPLVLPLFPLW